MALKSWVESAQGSDFPLESLPYCRFAYGRESRLGVGIGEHILDLYELAERGHVNHPGLRHATLNVLAAQGPGLHARLQEFLSAGQAEHSELLIPRKDAELLLPFEVGDYTDFYASIHHATRVGSMFRPDNPLLPNYTHIPIGYHGRSSTVVVSGTPVKRPHGQLKADDAAAPVFGPCKLLDYELEMGFYVGRGGTSIPISEAGSHIFGFSLVNDWSARDIQKWEYQPLGPFLAKSFATSVSPWVVPWEALQPYRCAPEERPEPLEYLRESAPAAFDIHLEVWLNGERLSQSNFRHMFWTVTQMLAHHASNGCLMRPGDLLASGTVSGPEVETSGCLLELGWQGPGQPRSRPFLKDGDEVVLRGYCVREGLPRISFGECAGTVIP